MLIRPIAEADWPAFYPVFHELVAAGETYAYPEGLGPDDTRALWVGSPPGVTVVAVGDGGSVLGSATAGPNRPSRGSHVATASFMVAAGAGGLRVGDARPGRAARHAPAPVIGSGRG